MRLDRNVRGDGRQKYGLVLNRRLIAMVMEADTPEQHAKVSEIEQAIQVLESAGIIDWGDAPKTEFFVIRLRDINARPALLAYASSAANHDLEYAVEITDLANRAGIKHPMVKRAD